MRVNATVKERVFSIDEITEKEGIVLRTLLNMSDGVVKEKLNDNGAYLINKISEEEANVIGRNIRDKIMGMVDEER